MRAVGVPVPAGLWRDSYAYVDRHHDCTAAPETSTVAGTGYGVVGRCRHPCPWLRCSRHAASPRGLRADAKRALVALDEIILQELGNAQKVRVGGVVQLTVRIMPATKKRTGRNPATGEAITIAAKPASFDVRARPLAKAKAALPSVQKARRRLAASNGRAPR